MEDELGLVGVNFNWTLTIFYIFYLMYVDYLTSKSRLD